MSKLRYCLFCVTYRDIDVQPRLAEMVQGLQNRAFFWSVKLGPIEKESVDCLVSEALVGIVCFMPMHHYFISTTYHYLFLPVHASDRH